MKVFKAFIILGVIVLTGGCASHQTAATAAAKPRRPLMRFTDPEKQQKILEEKIKVKIFALESLNQEKPALLQQLNEAGGKISTTNLLKQADAARASIQRDQSYLDALKSFYLSLSNRQQAVTAEFKVYRDALTNRPVLAVTNSILSK